MISLNQFYFCCWAAIMAPNNQEKVDSVFHKGSNVIRIGIRFLKMVIFGLGKGTSRNQSALLLMPLAQLLIENNITIELMFQSIERMSAVISATTSADALGIMILCKHCIFRTFPSRKNGPWWWCQSGIFKILPLLFSIALDSKEKREENIQYIPH